MVLRPDGSHFPNVHILTSWCWNTRFAFSLTVPPTTHFHCVFWSLCAADLVTWTFLLCVQAEGILKQNALQHVRFVLFGSTVSYLSLYFIQHSSLFLCSIHYLLVSWGKQSSGFKNSLSFLVLTTLWLKFQVILYSIISSLLTWKSPALETFQLCLWKFSHVLEEIFSLPLLCWWLYCHRPLWDGGSTTGTSPGSQEEGPALCWLLLQK